MSWLTDFLGYRVLYNAKNSILTTIENDLTASLATAKSEITDFGNKVQSTYTDVATTIQATMAGQTGDIYDGAASVIDTNVDVWIPQKTIIPAVGDTNEFLYAYVDFTTISNDSSEMGYVAISSANDYIGTVTTLGSMPSYSVVYGGSRPTPCALPLTMYKNTFTGLLEPKIQRLVIPINSRIKNDGIVIWTWKNTTSVTFSYNACGFVYRNASAY